MHYLAHCYQPTILHSTACCAVHCKLILSLRCVFSGCTVTSRPPCIYNIFIKISTSISSTQLCEYSPVESQLRGVLSKRTHCTVHLENIDIKDVKFTAMAWLQHRSGQFLCSVFICQYTQYKIFSIGEWKIFLSVPILCTEQCHKWCITQCMCWMIYWLSEHAQCE